MTTKDWLTIIGGAIFISLIDLLIGRNIAIPPLPYSTAFKMSWPLFFVAFIMLYFSTRQINRTKVKEVSRKLDGKF